MSAGCWWAGRRVQRGLPQPGEDSGLDLEQGTCVKSVSDTLGHRPREDHGSEQRVEVRLGRQVQGQSRPLHTGTYRRLTSGLVSTIPQTMKILLATCMATVKALLRTHPSRACATSNKAPVWVKTTQGPRSS